MSVLCVLIGHCTAIKCHVCREISVSLPGKTVDTGVKCSSSEVECDGDDENMACGTGRINMTATYDSTGEGDVVGLVSITQGFCTVNNTDNEEDCQSIEESYKRTAFRDATITDFNCNVTKCYEDLCNGGRIRRTWSLLLISSVLIYFCRI